MFKISLNHSYLDVDLGATCLEDIDCCNIESHEIVQTVEK